MRLNKAPKQWKNHATLRTVATALTGVLLATQSPMWAQEPRPAFPSITAEGAYAAVRKPFTELGGKSSSDPRNMYSNAKIMTAIIALEEKDPMELVTVGWYPTQAPASRSGNSLMKDSNGQRLQYREQLTLEALLYGMLLPSGNDAAWAVAEHVMGCVSTEGTLEPWYHNGPECQRRFVDVMNNRARTLCNEENICLGAAPFTMPHGTATAPPSGVARLADYALRIPRFAEIVSTVTKTILSTRLIGTKTYILQNTNRLLSTEPYPGAIGVKTGTGGNGTSTNLVSTVRLLGKTVVVSTMESDGISRWIDNKAVLDYAFDALFQINRGQDSGSEVIQAGIAMVPVFSNRIVTAIREPDGALKVISWYVKDSGIARENASPPQTEKPREIAIARLTESKIVTGVIDKSGNLKLITWEITAKAVTRGKNSASYGTTGVNLALHALSDSRVVTAIRDSSGSLRIDLWQMNTDGSWNRRDSFVQPETSPGKIDIAGPSGAHCNIGSCRIVTAVSTTDGWLRVTAWDITVKGGITQHADGPSEQWGNEVTVHFDPLLSIYTTAGRDTGGNLKLVSWSVSSGESTLTRLFDSGGQAGTASFIRTKGILESGVLTAVRTAEGTLRLILWGIAPDGQIKRVDDSAAQGGAVSDIALAMQTPNRYITAVRVDGNLKLITWKIDTAQ